MTGPRLSERYEFNLRIPLSLRVKLQEEADKNQRSLNAEINIRLERSTRETYRIT